MAASAIVASGTAAANSSDITIADGASALLSLFTVTGQAIHPGCCASIQYKSSNGEFFEVQDGVLDHAKPCAILHGPGVFRVVRKASTIAFGVDQS